MKRALNLLICALLCSAACARKSTESTPVAPKSAAPDPPGTLEALERDLAAAERRIAAELGQEQAFDAPAASGDPSEKSAEQPPPRRRSDGEPPSDALEERQQSPPSGAASTSPCATACLALSSMQRSADSICRLTGSAASRCTQARARVESAAERVRNAGCACRPR